ATSQVDFFQDRDRQWLQRDSATNARAWGNPALHQHLVLQLGRMEIAGDVLLDSQIVRFAFVLCQETRDGLGVAHDGAGDKVALLPERDDRSQNEESKP